MHSLDEPPAIGSNGDFHSSPSPSGGAHYLRFVKFLGPALKVHRIEAHLLQADVAQAISIETKEQVSQSYISRVEYGPAKPKGVGVSMDRLVLFCKVLGCKPSEVVQTAEFLAEQEARYPGDVLDDLRAEVEESLAKDGHG